MYIYWLGESSFKIRTDDTTIVIDPSDKKTGLTQSALVADIVVISNTLETDTKRIDPVNKDTPPFIINTPGEYETHGVFVYKIPGENNSTLSLIKADHISIAHLAGLSESLTSEQLELFEDADIALVPVGNKGVLSGKQADKIISEIEPRMVIPMNFAIPKLKISREPVDAFLAEMGEKTLKPETSLYVTKAKLPQDETKLVLLQP